MERWHGSGRASSSRFTPRREGGLRRDSVPVDVVVYDAMPGLQTWGPRALATLVTRTVDWFRRWIPSN
jgi:hypothetical protein